MAVFPGFSHDLPAFLAELAANNRKEWFDQNRDRYEAVLKSPALDFIAALAEPMSRLTPALQSVPRVNASLRRINRDIRFSADKSPYHDHLHLIFSTGPAFNRDPGMHFIIGAGGIGFGAGVYGLTPEELAAMRARFGNPRDRAALLDAVRIATATGATLTEPELKTLPRGHESDAPWSHLYRRKSLVIRTHDNPQHPDWLFTAGAADGLLDLTRAFLPFLNWFGR